MLQYRGKQKMDTHRNNLKNEEVYGLFCQVEAVTQSYQSFVMMHMFISVALVMGVEAQILETEDISLF